MTTPHSGELRFSPAPLSTLRESNRSLRTLFRTVDGSNDGEGKSDAILTFSPAEKQSPMAFAADLFQNGVLSPLPSPALKLPPRLQAAGSEAPSPRSPNMPATSPKPARKVSAVNKWKDFDPFEAAVERIRKNDATVLKPFYWRALERSFEQSFVRVVKDGEKGRCEWDYWDVVGGGDVEDCSHGIVCCTSRKQKWNPLSCIGSV